MSKVGVEVCLAIRWVVWGGKLECRLTMGRIGNKSKKQVLARIAVGEVEWVGVWSPDAWVLRAGM